MICHNFFTTHYLIETFDSPRLGVNYDPSHDVLVGIEDVSWVIRQWAARKRIKHVHLKDAAGTADGERFLFPMLEKAASIGGRSSRRFMKRATRVT